MFLTRFLLVASLCIAAPLTALAETNTVDQCVSGSQMGNPITIKDGDNQITPQYAMHFDTGKYAVPDACVEKVNNMFEQIKAKKDAGLIDGVLLFASTDTMGSTANNVDLSTNRLNTAKDKLKSIGIPETDITTKFFLGESAWPTNNDADWQKRAVYIFFTNTSAAQNVVNDVDICSKTVRDAIIGLETKLNAYKGDVGTAKEKLADLKSFCGEGRSNVGQGDIGDFEQKLAALMNALPAGLGTQAGFENELSSLTLQLKIARANKLYTDLVLTEGSVWKNADGTFNYHRLIADSAAGVVLGTAGGLLSSHLIKKAQIKEGFEDLQCTIGGQLVANWGDQFLPTMTVAP